MELLFKNRLGKLRGNDCGDHYEFLGIKYASAERFEYAVPIDSWDGELDCTHYGTTCPQSRMYHEHLENPKRLFYHKEFRDGRTYDYNEDCLNLNIYTPKSQGPHSVIIFIHGGGFNSGSPQDNCFDGRAYATRDTVLVTINYRVGILGYLTHEEIYKKNGHDGNFGLHDQLTAVKWVKRNISEFGGDSENITLMGQSAGAISIQYLCLMKECEGLFRHAIMLSGGGCFPKFALPRPYERTREYWLEFMDLAGLKDFDDLKKADLELIFDTIETIKKKRKDSTYNTMPVIDDFMITAPVDKMIETPIDVDTIISFTNNDMFAPIMADIGIKYAKKHGSYTLFFDVDAPGVDKNGAFHSSDLWYVFGTMDRSARPYTDKDRETAGLVVDYFCAFAKNGNPNHKGAPDWSRTDGRSLCIKDSGVVMGRPNKIKLTWNMLTKGDPTP